MISTRVRALVAGVAVLVADLHRAAAGAAEHDALAERSALARRPGAGVGAVGGQPRLVGQVVLPGDVSGMVVADQYLPLFPGQLGNRRAHGPVRGDDLLRA